MLQLNKIFLLNYTHFSDSFKTDWTGSELLLVCFIKNSSRNEEDDDETPVFPISIRKSLL